MSQKDKYVQRYKIKILVFLETAQSLIEVETQVYLEQVGNEGT